MITSHTVGHTNSFYQPKKDDIVIGIVDKRSGEDWLVDIGFSHQAVLPQLSFDGATKKNCPKFERGETVVAFVEEVPESGEVILSCIGRTKNEKLGRVTGGSLVRARPKDIQRISEYKFIDKIGNKTPIVASFAQNGRLYIDASNDVITVLLVHAITRSLESDDPVKAFDQEMESINFENRP
ncbi:Exosome component 3 [Tritrichomonas musculus]|uniref:Exosome component 3 n=1 Tax=Tritrichomonas musculus TaxID=1915356 RepID=A0ABR2KGW8_9EUKA